MRYYGDEIAAMVAESDLAAQKALEAIRVEYEELPPLLTPEAAVISGIPLHEKSPDNQGGRMDFIIDEPKCPVLSGNVLHGSMYRRLCRFTRNKISCTGPATLPY
ncbi:MAG: hypothetical protein ACLUIW_03580 [Dysosmobacter welbionis]